MLFSVIIPTCNRNEVLSMCLNLLSPKVQTFDGNQYEVIVTDDGKESPAKKMIETRHPWVQWIEGPHKGPAANRNNGAKYAKGEWLVFFDDDCLPATNILNTYNSYIVNHSGINVLEGKVERPNRRTSVLDYAPCNYNGGNLWSCNFAIIKPLFKEIGGFDENFKYAHLEDNDLKKRIEASGEKILFAVEAKVHHPWRKLNGKSLGRNEEMSLYFNSKYGGHSNYINYIKRIIAQHAFMVKRSFRTNETLPALKVLSQHLGILLLNFHKWKKRYSKI
ncbi:MAG: glycosyltransferase [Bacteroidota bacterium]|nr:glycosyltransferase [Bacteroidota bacterium]